VAWSTTF